MKSYEEMAEAVFREGVARLAAKRKRDKKIAAGAAVGLALAVGLTVYGIVHRMPEAVPPALLSAPEATTGIITATQEATAQPGNAQASGTATTQPPDTMADDRSVAGDRQPEATTARSAGEEPARMETPTGGAQNRPREEATTATLTTTPSGEQPSGAASYNSRDWTEPAVNQSGWARFPRWPGYEDKFWVYYDGRTYRCDPYAGQPQTYGEYLCGLSDCAHNFADEDGAGVYVMLEDGAPVPVDTAIVIVFPDGACYAMLREPSQE